MKTFRDSAIYPTTPLKIGLGIYVIVLFLEKSIQNILPFYSDKFAWCLLLFSYYVFRSWEKKNLMKKYENNVEHLIPRYFNKKENRKYSFYLLFFIVVMLGAYLLDYYKVPVSFIPTFDAPAIFLIAMVLIIIYSAIKMNIKDAQSDEDPTPKFSLNQIWIFKDKLVFNTIYRMIYEFPISEIEKIEPFASKIKISYKTTDELKEITFRTERFSNEELKPLIMKYS